MKASTKSSEDRTEKKVLDSDSANVVLKSAPPPWHSVAALGMLSAVFVRCFPSNESLDQVATVQTFTRVLFPNLLNVYSLAYIRLLMALTIWWITFSTAIFSNGSIIIQRIWLERN
jgi:hypothetical protein